MRCAIIHSAEAFSALAERWDDLARATDAGLFLSHTWLCAWWRAFHGVDDLWIFTVEDDAGQLVAGWPLHLRAPRSGALRVAELRVLGDLGGADQSVLCRPGQEPPACAALVDALLWAREWDVLDVPTSRREITEAIERALVGAGAKFDRSPVDARPYLDLPAASDWDEFARTRRPQRTVGGAVYATAELDVPHALDELLRLLRK